MKRILAALCTLAFLLTASGRGQEKVLVYTPRHLPGDGVADPDGKIGFFPNTMGGIDAIDLATGKLIWRSKDAKRPLLATEKHLFVQNQASIFVLTSDGGKRILEAKPIPFPNWVAVETAYGRSYRGSARLEGKVLLVSWEARAFYAGGARPTPEIEKAARKEASGVARVSLETGKIGALDEIKAGKFFPMPADAINPKAGALILTIKDGTAKNPKGFVERRRTLQAVNEAKQVMWEREIAAPVFLPPRP